ncbi:uncharacterized protein [Mytilus edulis]|uniref:uncharacterized protein n=1 Tax=Mytilus edulis TaxID=6550 RepID=UPI0039EFD54D
MGDFNAKVGMNNEGLENTMRRHGIGRRNENGENLDICQRNNLAITVTIFPHKDKHKETATNTIGFKERGQKPWIPNESWKLVDERRQLKERNNNSRSERVKNSLNAKYSDKDKEVKKSMRNDKRQWTDNLIEEAEKAASNGMMKTVTRTICNEKRKPPQVIKDKSGNPLSNHDEKLKRWKEHFQEVLNRPEHEIPFDININYEIEEREIDIGPIRKEEITKALKRLKNGKSGGIDGITAEILKADTITTTKYLHKLYNMIWIGDEIPRVE